MRWPQPVSALACVCLNLRLSQSASVSICVCLNLRLPQSVSVSICVCPNPCPPLRVSAPVSALGHEFYILCLPQYLSASVCVCLSPCLASILLIWLVIVRVNGKRGLRVAQCCCTQSLHQGGLEAPHFADACFWQDVFYYVWNFLAKGFFGTTLENQWPYHWNGRYSLQVLKSICFYVSLLIFHFYS